MNMVLQKLRSRTGASITFALLLFLVCAVLSSVILVAATTASGRMSQLAETDQRYYAVTSAGELLKDLLDGESVSVVKETVTKSVDGATQEVNTNTYIIEGLSGSDAAKAVSEDNKVSSSVLPPVTNSILTDAAYKYATQASSGTQHSLRLSASVEAESLAVSVTETVDLASGDIVMIVSNTNGDKFTQRLTFAADVKENRIVSSQEEKSLNGAAIQTTTTETLREVTTITWRLFSVETLTAAAGG